jgi:uncharacterized coiled-coil DUF342 family protein
MDATQAAEARERLTKWIEETRQLLALLPELSQGDHHATERLTAAEREIDRLRRETEDLKRENLQLRAEKDEVTQAMAQVAQKLGLAPRKSPFERHPAPAPEPPRAPEPAAARPGEPPKP